VSIFLLVSFDHCFCLFMDIFAPGGNFYTSLTALRAAFFRRSPPAENSNVFTRPGCPAGPGALPAAA
jgi:hypothetical protein